MGLMVSESAKGKIAGNRRTVSDNVPKSGDMLSTGSTLLNLACTGRITGGFPKGYYILFVGDSDSGKTFVCMSCLAEAAINPAFDNYRFIYDGGEFGAQMDLRKFFGEGVAERLEPPAVDDDGNPLPSHTIEEFYFNLDDALNHEKPCIYIQDSMDVLTSDYEGKKFDEKKREVRGGPKAKGDYGDGKAKINSRWIRQVQKPLQQTGSILIIINQSRDNMDAGLFDAKKTHSGGNAITFYSSIKLWSVPGPNIKRKVRGIDRQLGRNIRVDVKRTRVTGRQSSVHIPIYWSYGIDDLGSCVDYLVAEGHWKKNRSGIIRAPEIDDFEGRQEKLIQKIDQENKGRQVRKLVGKIWREVEDASALKRTKRY